MMVVIGFKDLDRWMKLGKIGNLIEETESHVVIFLLLFLDLLLLLGGGRSFSSGSSSRGGAAGGGSGTNSASDVGDQGLKIGRLESLKI